MEIKTGAKISLLELIKILEEHRNSIIINFKHLQENYQHQGIKRIKGVRDTKGDLIEPWLKTQYIDAGEYVDMGTFELNRNTATINMLIKRRVKLVTAEDKTPIIEVAGLLANDLYTFNNYTVVSDGEVNIRSLRVKISAKKTFDLLKAKGVILAGKFDFRSEYEILFDNLPLVTFDAHFNNVDGLFYELAQMKVLLSIIRAHLKQKSDVYIPDQLDELQKHYLSKNVYLNFPTTNEYTDINTALATGVIDTRVSYKIDIGSRDILNFGKLMSANRFLDRMYRAYDSQTRVAFQKAIFEMTWEENISFRRKSPSARMKITAVDDLMAPIFDDFLGFENNGIVSAILNKVGAGADYKILEAKRNGISVNKEETVAAFTAANTKLSHYIDRVYRENISPLIFYIGSTGILPDQIDGKAVSAIELAAKYPNLQFSEDEKNGTFFEVGNSIIGVYAKTEYYSTRIPTNVET
ncbi:hypothetical protein DSM106972_014900 [Dulcicalothrix desertica PCC 7102]|uniref:Uncharacterized protein n=1 Tax=Dulcicalothrix desertica PCC 7102 TaxID=232991 RepID=A0A3S1CIS6_9CYAN|nr:hypothetical protein [Dulcicalothrix desertica]RUT08322.1 hypothetical protein DSM106972_014900 [Dulcicalothrix desertica PCC 7102]TWH40187.1 hypothetical protein CAL7102_09490 [Dulcicalothrix desertica PCC 7102]